MKKILLCAVFLVNTLFSFSQEAKSKVPFKPEHEFRLGVGAFPLVSNAPWMNDVDYYWGTTNFTNRYNEELVYEGAQHMTGAISVGYSYNIKRWVSVGVTFSYFGIYRNLYDKITDEKVAHYNRHNLSLTPMVRFTYFNSKYIRLYSQLGLGLGWDLRDRNTGNYKHVYFTGHLTPFGISIGGEKLFGFAEFLGVGNQGAFVLGIGYKFKK